MSRRKPNIVIDPSEFSVKLKDVVPTDLKKLSNRVNSRVVGQERATRKIIRVISMLEAGINDKNRVLPIILFAGPHGVGKTYLARVVAEEWIGKPEGDQPDPLVVLSGEDYSDRHTGNTLLGSPHGYVGYQDKTPLEDIGAFERDKYEDIIIEELQEWHDKITEEYGENITEEIEAVIHGMIHSVYEHYVEQCGPFRSVLLIDEFEEMHPVVQKQFLTIFTAGMLKLRSGKTIDLRSTLVIITSNIGSEEIAKLMDEVPVGFQAPQDDNTENQDQQIYKVVKDKIRKTLPPKLYSRIGHEGIVVFHRLTEDDYVNIIDLEIGKVQNEVIAQEEEDGTIVIHASEEFYKFILENADAHREGARQIERLIDKYMREPLSQQVKAGTLRDGDEIMFTIKNGKTKIYRKPRPKTHRLPLFTRELEKPDEDSLRSDVSENLDELWQEFAKELYKKHHGKPPPELPENSSG